MNLLYVDVVGGAAGDMLLAALLDAGASRTLVSGSASSVFGRRVECATAEVLRHGLRALALVLPGDLSTVRRRPRELIEAVERASLDDGGNGSWPSAPQRKPRRSQLRTCRRFPSPTP